VLRLVLVDQYLLCINWA